MAQPAAAGLHGKNTIPQIRRGDSRSAAGRERVSELKESASPGPASVPLSPVPCPLNRQPRGPIPRATWSLLEGRSAVVTAASKGIGRAVVQSLAEAGMRVVARACSEPEHLPASAHFVSADFCTADGCRRLARVASDYLAQVDALVNVLGGSTAPPGGFAALDEEACLREITSTFSQRCV
jgi:hypothetical protein